MDPKDPKFLKLQKKWYDKLAKKGFEDIEQDEMRLKQYSGKTSLTLHNKKHVGEGATGMPHYLESYFSNPEHQVGTSMKYEYYAECRSFLQTHEFETVKLRKIFEMHSEGIGLRDISKVVKLSRGTVGKRLNELIKVMRGR